METNDGQGSALPKTESAPVEQQLDTPAISQCSPPIPQYPPPMPQDLFAPPQYSFIPPQLFPSRRPTDPPVENPLPQTTIIDIILAAILLMLGFCFWDWELLANKGAGFGATVFFLVAIAISFTYLRSKGIRQNKHSLLMLLVAVAGSLPFALNGSRDISALLLLFETAACLLWVLYSCRTSISNKLSGLIIGDMINQVFVVGFGNIPHFFSQPFKKLQRGKKALKFIFFAAIGFVVCIPVFFLVTVLLSSADDGFREFIVKFFNFLDSIDVFDIFFKLVFGIPVAAYIFGVVFGNYAKQHVNHLTGDGFLCTFEKAHALPRAAIYLPLGLFVALYLVFFITMGSYLFSGLQGLLPVDYTYAEYARRGFFELCTVAVINLFILSAIWLLTSRSPREYPLLLRILSGVLAFLTCLLVITAMSKMLLYVQTYGLSQLRLYTSCFMVLLLLVFALLVVWHFKPFNAARPIIILVFVFSLGLGLANTNGFIAHYNVDRYLSGQTDKIDISMLIELGDAAVPALDKLEQNAKDTIVRKEASDAIWKLHVEYEQNLSYNNCGLTTWGAWHTQSLQSLRADWLYEKRQD